MISLNNYEASFAFLGSDLVHIDSRAVTARLRLTSFNEYHQGEGQECTEKQQANG